MIKKAGKKKELIAALKKAVEDSDGNQAECFNPRDGVRFILNDKPIDFVICFECLSMVVYQGGKGETVLIGKKQEAVFAKLCKDLRIKRAGAGID